jgi:hypothetical protein
MKADYIVIGRLINVEKQAICVEHKNYRDIGKTARFYLDTGTILATKRLFPVSLTQQNLPSEALQLPFASHSRSHPQGNGNYMGSSSQFHFDEGDEGIWILKREKFADHFTVVRPDNFLPLDSLNEVESAISQVTNFISEQKEKKSKQEN